MNVPGATKPAMPMLPCPVIAAATGCGAGRAARPSRTVTVRYPGFAIFLPKNTLPTVMSRYAAPPMIATSPESAMMPIIRYAVPANS